MLSTHVIFPGAEHFMGDRQSETMERHFFLDLPYGSETQDDGQ
jgi:hypothetical protein